MLINLFFKNVSKSDVINLNPYRSTTEADKEVKKSGPIEEDFTAEPNYSKLAEGTELNLYDNLKWTIWENIAPIEDSASSKNMHEQDWDLKTKKVAWFDNLITFHKAWNSIQHADLSNIFYDPEKQSFKV